MLAKLRHRVIVRILVVAPLLAGTVYGPSCLETTLLALNPCGTVLDCDPADYYAIIWPVITAPDYDRDPSCTIPYACGDWYGDAPTILTPTGGT